MFVYNEYMFSDIPTSWQFDRGLMNHVVYRIIISSENRELWKLKFHEYLRKLNRENLKNLWVLRRKVKV